MNNDRWRILRRVLDEALDLESDARADYVSQACEGDDDLRLEVEEILAAHDRGGDLLEQPVLRLGREETASEEERITHAGPYRLSEPIGEGGMGKVYVGHRNDDAYQKQVAIKVLRPGRKSDELLRRFKSERQILATLEHTYIAKLLDGGTTENGQPYLVMEYVDGLPIDDYCIQRDLSVEQRLDLLIKVCEAIQYAHRNLIVHRDLKPSNILVTEDGVPKLLDFGIAKILSPESFPQTVLPTRTGFLPMTPEYASPEQIRGEAVTTATDVYALGVLLYEILAGERPYKIDGGSLESIVEMICRRTPPKPSTAVLDPTDGGPRSLDEAQRISRRLAGDLDAIVLRALRKEPSERYASAAQLAEDLERHLGGRPVEARRSTFIYLATKFVSRYRIAVGSLASIFVLLIGFVVALLVQQQKILDQRDQVLLERNRAEEVSGWWFELFKLPAPSRAKGEQVLARELLDKGSKMIDELPDLDLQSELLSTMGHTYVQLGLHQEGIDLLLRSIELTRSPDTKFPESLGERLQRLSEAMTLHGDFRQAEVVSREMLALHQQRGDSGAIVSLALARFGHLRDLQGNQQQAADFLTAALTMARDSGDSFALAKVLEYVGDERMHRGDLDAARAMYEEGLDLLQVEHGDLHPDVALMKSSLASAEKGQRAEQLFEEAIATQRQLFDEAHPYLATALNNLGLLLFENQRFTEARERLEEATAMQSELYGEKHWKFAVMLGNLANVERALGNLDRAEELNRQAIEIFESSVGDQHADYALALSNLAELRLQKGALEEAASLADQAVEVTQNALGAEHPRMTDVLNTRGLIETVQNDLVTAEETLKQAVGIADASQGDRHPTLPSALKNLSTVFTRLERIEESVDALTRALSLIDQDGQPTVRFLQWSTVCSDLQIQLEHYAEAEVNALKAYEGWRAMAGDTKAWTLSAQRLLALAKLGQGKLDEAEPILVEVITRLETTQPTGSSQLDQARKALAELTRKRDGSPSDDLSK